MINQGFKDLLAYQKAFQQACQIFDITLKFPKEERYSLTDQIRRSSRSVCANLAEDIEKEAITNTIFLNYLIVWGRIVKLSSGSTSLYIAIILLKMIIYN